MTHGHRASIYILHITEAAMSLSPSSPGAKRRRRRSSIDNGSPLLVRRGSVDVASISAVTRSQVKKPPTFDTFTEHTLSELFVTPLISATFNRKVHRRHAAQCGLLATFAALILLVLDATNLFRLLVSIYFVSMLSVLWYLTYYVECVNKELSKNEAGLMTISELCRKTDTYAHKCLLILSVGCGSLLTGIYYIGVCLVPDSPALRLNLISSMLLLLTGIFPMASPEADACEAKRRENPGSTHHHRVAIRTYEGERQSWWNDSVTSTLHCTGIYSFVGFSLLTDLLIRRYLFVGVLTAAITVFMLMRVINIPRLSVFFESVVVTLVVSSHAADSKLNSQPFTLLCFARSCFVHSVTFDFLTFLHFPTDANSLLHGHGRCQGRTVGGPRKPMGCCPRNVTFRAVERAFDILRGDSEKHHVTAMINSRYSISSVSTFIYFASHVVRDRVRRAFVA
jgi:hypothetical protein